MNLPIIRPVSPFAAATLLPVPLLLVGGLFGGIFILAALLYMVVLTLILDALIRTAGPEAAPGSEFPAAEKLSLALGFLHFPLLAVGVAGVSGSAWLGFWEGVAALVAFGLYFGQVSNSNAHELIHRADRQQFNLGKWVLISLLYGHHVTAHLKIHHRFVATPEDPNSARLGEGFYGFARRAWIGAFQAGWEIENSISEMKGRRLPFWRHPYAEYAAGGLGFALLSILAFGLSGLIAYLLLALYAQAQLLLSDYVQHYGLQRRRIDGERFEPVAPWHSWNAAHWLSGGLMLNAPRHSEHHIHPAKPYPELSLPGHMEGPRLPHSLPAMATIALVPPLWRRLMDRRARSWQGRIEAGEILRTAPPPLIPAPRKASPAPGRAEPASEADAPVLAAVAAAAESAPAGERRAAQASQDAKPEGGAGGSKPDDAAPSTMFVRSSALAQAPGDPADPADPAGGMPGNRDADEAELASIRQFTSIDAMRPAASATGRKRGQDNAAEADFRRRGETTLFGNGRRRFDFPELEPADPPPEPTAERRRRVLIRGAAQAARSLAALLRGAPPSGSRD